MVWQSPFMISQGPDNPVSSMYFLYATNRIVGNASAQRTDEK